MALALLLLSILGSAATEPSATGNVIGRIAASFGETSEGVSNGHSVVVPMPGLPSTAKSLELVFLSGRVAVQPFFIGKYEITQGQYQTVMNTNPSKFKFGSDYPVETVNWNDCQEFCRKLTERLPEPVKGQASFRLPTDAEWSLVVGLPEEKGATPMDRNAKIPNAFPWGKQWPPPVGAGNYDRTFRTDNFDRTSPVGSFKPNQAGLCDLGGNVSEWCEDLHGIDRESRVVRGAAWSATDPVCLWSSYRLDYPPEDGFFTIGLRVVLALGPTPGSVAVPVPAESTFDSSVTNTNRLLPAQPSRRPIEPEMPVAPSRANVTVNPLVKFKYFRSPHQFSTYSDEPKHCGFCGRMRPGYDGPFYGGKEVKFICESCLAKGQLATKKNSTNQGHNPGPGLERLHPEFSKAKVRSIRARREEELIHRTPPLPTVRETKWPVHCGDFCCFLQEVGKADLDALSANHDGKAFLAGHLYDGHHDESVDAIWNRLRPDSPPNSRHAKAFAIYLFQCLECKRQLLLPVLM